MCVERRNKDESNRVLREQKPNQELIDVALGMTERSENPKDGVSSTRTVPVRKRYMYRWVDKIRFISLVIYELMKTNLFDQRIASTRFFPIFRHFTHIYAYYRIFASNGIHLRQSTDYAPHKTK